ncbi:hypothetical protein AAFF_G00348160 [Aldrovandia affinis]|uniref:Outer dense fiber protein 2-like n=1 Tax=Aldrovandia affinis TaxID=143900 RepID=A0AAD7W035_9TELE|nr:hypothetical protein AAFF_G00348160 [Aldrovandia affinis]
MTDGWSVNKLGYWLVTNSMKARPSSPVHVHVDDIATVHVHVQRSQSLPSSTETDHSVKGGPASEPGGRATRKRKEKKAAHKSYSSERTLYKSHITPKQADQICSVIRASDCDLGRDEAAPAAQVAELGGSSTSAERARSISSERASSRMSAAELAQGSSGQGGGGKVVERTARHSELARERSHCEELSPENGQLLLKTLQEAEQAANCAAIQLMSFREALGDDSAESRLHSSDERCMSRQKQLLLEKLDVFKSVNRSVRQQLKAVHNQEANRLEADSHMYILLKKLTQTESENLSLKRDLGEKRRRLEELIDLHKKEVEKLEAAVQHSKAVETTRAHLQGQLRHKESENSRLAVQLRGLERTIAEQKLEAESLKTQVASCSEKEREEKEALKKATRAQKQRAEKFEAAVEKSYARLREKDAELAEVRSKVELWRRRHGEAAEGTAPLEAQIAALKLQISDLTAQLQSERDHVRTSNEELLQKVDKLNSENGDLLLENATLKASVTDLEEKWRLSLAELQELAAVAQSQREQAEDYQTQVAGLQKEAEELKAHTQTLLKEKEEARGEGGRAPKVQVREQLEWVGVEVQVREQLEWVGVEVQVREQLEWVEVEVQVREQLEGRVSALEGYPALLSAAERRAQECQDSLARAERTLALKAHELQQLQLQAGQQTEQLGSSLGMKDSIKEANAELQGKVDSLQRRVEEVELENRELVHKLSGQEEALQYSSGQLQQRSSECLSLTRQLENALADVKQQISIVREKAGARERTLQSKIQELESERNRREKELKALRLNRESAEKQYEVRLKEVQLQLDQSESHKRSIQNYVDFLKSSYAAMFEDSLSPDIGFSSFLK